MRTSSFKPWLDVGIVIAPWLGFFLVQAMFQQNNEALLTAVATLICVFILRYKYEKGELRLFTIGLLLGLLIEVGLGLLVRQQHWTNASLLGVPYWLPLVWGYGFVAMRRAGNIIVPPKQ